MWLPKIKSKCCYAKRKGYVYQVGRNVMTVCYAYILNFCGINQKSGKLNYIWIIHRQLIEGFFFQILLKVPFFNLENNWVILVHKNLPLKWNGITNIAPFFSY